MLDSALGCVQLEFVGVIVGLKVGNGRRYNVNRVLEDGVFELLF